MKIVWSDRAYRDLDAIEAYIERDNPVAANRIHEHIADTVALLGQHPQMGRIGRAARTREFVVPGTPYIVAYTVKPSETGILAVIHGARKWPAELP